MFQGLKSEHAQCAQVNRGVQGRTGREVGMKWTVLNRSTLHCNILWQDRRGMFMYTEQVHRSACGVCNLVMGIDVGVNDSRVLLQLCNPIAVRLGPGAEEDWGNSQANLFC